MRISYFSYLYDLYGASIGSTIKALELLHALESFGHSVRIHWRKEKEVDQTEGIQKVRSYLKRRLDLVLHEPNQVIKNLNYLRQEIAILQKDRPDLLIARLESNVFSPPVLAGHFKIPYIAEVDSPVMYELRVFNKSYKIPYALLERMELEFILRADKAFCVSESLKSHFVNRGIPARHIEVIPNAADVSRFFPGDLNVSLREKYQLNGRLVIGFVGSFHYWHGVKQLQMLIQILLTRYRQVVFLLIGKGGPDRSELETFIQSGSFTDRVRMLDSINHDEIPSHIRAMDIVLAPYPDLPFFYYSPVKIFEYMACGRPVVASGLGQINDLIKHQKTGMLCRPGQLDDFIEHTSLLIEKPAVRQSIGKAAAAFIRKNHTWAHRAKQLDNLIKHVL
jgi:glycosyltransferase involved in cell wall biosynthesis